MFYVYGRWARS